MIGLYLKKPDNAVRKFFKFFSGSGSSHPRLYKDAGGVSMPTGLRQAWLG